MIFNKLKNCIFLFIFSVTLFSATSSQSAGLCSRYFQFPHEFAIQNFLDLAQTRFADFDSNRIQVVEIKNAGICTGDCTSGKIELHYGSNIIVTAQYGSYRKDLRFDIDVKKNYKRLGIYYFLFSKVILKYPHAKFVSAAMKYKYSENARAFKDAVFRDEDFPFDEVRPITLLSQQEIQALRTRILHAIFENYSIKVRRHFGFAHIIKVILTTNIINSKDGLSYVVEKGEQGAIEPDIIIQDRMNLYPRRMYSSAYFKLLPNGNVQNVPEQEASLGDYSSIPGLLY